MSEETIFNGTFNVGADTSGAEESVSRLQGIIDEFSEKANGSIGKIGAKFAWDTFTGGIDAAAYSLDHAIVRVGEFENQATDLKSGLDLLYESPKQGFVDFWRDVRLAMRQVGDENGSLIQGVIGLTSAAEQATSNFESLRGVNKIFAGLGAAMDSGPVKGFRRLLGLIGQTDTAVGSQINDLRVLTDTLKVQSNAWRETVKEQVKSRQLGQRIAETARDYSLALKDFTPVWKMVQELTEEELKNNVNIREELKAHGVQVGSLAAAQATANRKYQGYVEIIRAAQAAYERLVSENQELFKRSGVEKLAVDTNNLEKTVENLEQQYGQLRDSAELTGRVQTKLISRTINEFNSASRAATGLASQWKANDEISEAYLGRLGVGGEKILKLFKQMKAAGGEIPESIENVIQRIERGTIALDKESKRIQKGEKRAGKAFDDSNRQRTSRFRNLIEVVKGATGQVAEYTKETKKAADSNRSLMQFVKPRGVINEGLTQVGAKATRSSAAAYQLSTSLGTVIGIASALGGTLGQMNPAFSALIGGLAALSNQFIKSFTAIMSVSGTTAQKVQAAMGIMSSSLLSFGLMATGAVVKFGMVGAEAKTLEITMIQIAKNLAKEAGGDMEKFGDYVVNLRNKIRDTGIETRQATNAMSQFLRARLPVGRVEELAQAAKNLGVTVANMSSSEVFGRFIQFIQTGNSALLDAIGISKNASKMLDEYAVSIGKSSSKMLTPYEKQVGLIEKIIEETETVEGVYDEAQKTAGKQLSSMQRLFSEFMLNIGKYLEPLLADIIIGMNKILKWFNSLDPKVHEQIANFIKWTAIVGTLTGAILSAAPALRALIPIIRKIGATTLKAMPYLLAVSAAVGAIMVVVKALKQAWDQNMGGIQTSVNRLVKTIKSFLQPVIEELGYWWGLIMGEMGRTVGVVADSLDKLFNKLRVIVESGRAKIAVLLTSLHTIIGGFGATFLKTFQAINALLSGDTEKATELAKDAFLNLVTTIIIIFDDLIVRAGSWGWNLIVTFANEVSKAANTVITEVFEGIGDLIGLFIKPGSPPKKGPLRHIVEWGKGLMDTYLNSFSKADFGTLRDIMSPISQAFEDASAAGNLGEAQVIPNIKAVREDVGQLISIFRQTGEVNEEVMASISDKLGEGGEDLIEYVNRILDHEKALQNLSSVQEEYAEAQAAGFVPRELKDKLKAAEDEVDATKEAVNWQKEYLAAQRETIDMQLRQLKILEKIAEKLDKAGKGKKGKEKMEPVEFKLPEDYDKTAEDVDKVSTSVGSLSKEFLDLKGAVAEWLALPLDEKLSSIVTKIAELAGIPLPADWDSMSLANQIGFVFDALWTRLEEKSKEWGKTLGKRINHIWGLAVEHVGGFLEEQWGKLLGWFQGLWTGFTDTLKDEREMGIFAKDLGEIWGTITGKSLDLIFEEIPKQVIKLIAWFGDLVGNFVGDIIENPGEYGKKLLNMHIKVWGSFISFINEDIPKFNSDLSNWFENLIEGFVNAVIENGPDWIGDLGAFGEAFIGKIIQGVEDHWFKFKEFLRGKLGWVADQLPFSEPKDPTSPLRGLSKSGEALIDNWLSGMRGYDVEGVVTHRLAEVGSMFRGMSGIGGSNRNSYFQYGAFANAFPNVRNKEDAQGIMDQLDEIVSRKRAASYVGG